MSIDACERCGATDGTVTSRRFARFSAELCDRCYESMAGVSDPETGVTTAWVFIASMLLLVAAVAAAVILSQ
jgi:hypothetical protein